MRALIADDHFLFRNLLQKILAAREVTGIELAEDGSAARLAIAESIARKTPYGLVFLDWHMPDVSGLELLGLIRAARAYDASPVYMITADRESHSVTAALSAGATAYIIKPITPAVLDRRVGQALQLIAGGFCYAPPAPE